MSEATGLKELEAALWDRIEVPLGAARLQDVALWIKTGTSGHLDPGATHARVKLVALALKPHPRMTDEDMGNIHAEIKVMRKAMETLARGISTMHARSNEGARRIGMPVYPLPSALQSLADALPDAIEFMKNGPGRPAGKLWHSVARAVAPEVAAICNEFGLPRAMYMLVVCAIVEGWTGQAVTPAAVRQCLI